MTHFKLSPKQKAARVFSYLFMALCVLVALFPIVWVVLSSFKTNREILSNGLQLPSTFSFSGYKQALEMAPILKFFVNSLIVSFASTALNVFILAMAGYVFAKKKFRFKNLIFGILSLSMVIPSTALMSPVYTVITKLHLYDTKMALILVYTALNMPISLMILRSAFAAIPTELEEAAYIDGAGFFRTFFRVIEVEDVKYVRKAVFLDRAAVRQFVGLDIVDGSAYIGIERPILAERLVDVQHDVAVGLRVVAAGCGIVSVLTAVGQRCIRRSVEFLRIERVRVIQPHTSGHIEPRQDIVTRREREHITLLVGVARIAVRDPIRVLHTQVATLHIVRPELLHQLRTGVIPLKELVGREILAPWE